MFLFSKSFFVVVELGFSMVLERDGIEEVNGDQMIVYLFWELDFIFWALGSVEVVQLDLY